MAPSPEVFGSVKIEDGGGTGGGDLVEGSKGTKRLVP